MIFKSALVQRFPIKHSKVSCLFFFVFPLKLLLICLFITLSGFLMCQINLIGKYLGLHDHLHPAQLEVFLFSLIQQKKHRKNKKARACKNTVTRYNETYNIRGWPQVGSKSGCCNGLHKLNMRHMAEFTVESWGTSHFDKAAHDGVIPQLVQKSFYLKWTGQAYNSICYNYDAWCERNNFKEDSNYYISTKKGKIMRMQKWKQRKQLKK